MFDIPSPSLPRKTPEAIENPDRVPSELLKAIAELSDAEIDALVDDLDFYAFTGLASRRIATLMPAVRTASLEAA